MPPWTRVKGDNGLSCPTSPSRVRHAEDRPLRLPLGSSSISELPPLPTGSILSCCAWPMLVSGPYRRRSVGFWLRTFHHSEEPWLLGTGRARRLQALRGRPGQRTGRPSGPARNQVVGEIALDVTVHD